MDNKQNEATFINELLRTFGIIFTLSILAISVVLMISFRFTADTQDITALFASGGNGLSFAAILQIAGFAIVISCIKVLLFSEYIFFNMRFLWRTFLLLLMTLLTFSVFTVIFNWIPANDPWSWVRFVLSTLICFSIGFCLTLLKLKLEGKKYDRLLTKYKANALAKTNAISNSNGKNKMEE